MRSTQFSVYWDLKERRRIIKWMYCCWLIYYLIVRRERRRKKGMSQDGSKFFALHSKHFPTVEYDTHIPLFNIVVNLHHQHTQHACTWACIPRHPTHLCVQTQTKTIEHACTQTQQQYHLPTDVSHSQKTLLSFPLLTIPIQLNSLWRHLIQLKDMF